MKPGKSLMLAAASLLAFMPLGAKPGFPVAPVSPAKSWAADNGNGTFTNPIFNEELEDPDIIRVGDTFYMTGTTMHVMPALPVLRSKDLVNWELIGYAADRIDMGPEYRMEGGKETYGQGIWAPVIRYHDGTFYIFSNINGYGLQIFTAKDPAGPWTHRSLGGKTHDLGVLFDDDGRIYAAYGYNEVHLIEFKKDLSGFIEGSDRVIIPAGSGMGEGHHFYKINGKYYIVSANYAPVGRMQAARADRIDGPYETVTISARETMGIPRRRRVNGADYGPLPAPGADLKLSEPNPNSFGAVPIHQGGVVDLPNGDWWGFSMSDVGSAGRMVMLSPVTWQDGWPYFGLPGNLGRSPRTWLKPAVATPQKPGATWDRDDDFRGPALKPIWQWNHVPVDAKWSLREKPGALRLHTLPAPDLLLARNSLTQRVAAPLSTATVTLDGRGLRAGDVAGLALFAIPDYWIGLVRTPAGLVLRMHDQAANHDLDRPIAGTKVFLRASGDFDSETGELSFSTDGTTFTPIGGPLKLAFGLKIFQGYRYALFAYNSAGAEGGYADFDDFRVNEPLADRSGDIPLGKVITIANLADGKLASVHELGLLHVSVAGSKEAASLSTRFRVLDRGQGRVALEALDGSGFLTVTGIGISGDVRLMKQETPDSLFQWQDMLRHQFMLMSLKTHRYIGVDPATGEPYGADWPGTSPDRKNGTVMQWAESAGR
ncbi:glycoside hydrolase 43 family protein [Sphingomonas sp.]|uniref:glycoside hydrolase family 43 protein n=1 Tax=Sphingomonas sp. TaxID=28214 RepID=UPI000DB7CC91|nr:glycoside hydrolase 43 family protein [Sphingomonas sp.]PZU08146.1 MAG: glycoside hydrolase [Sphingomonas sp.]